MPLGLPSRRSDVGPSFGFIQEAGVECVARHMNQARHVPGEQVPERLPVSGFTQLTAMADALKPIERIAALLGLLAASHAIHAPVLAQHVPAFLSLERAKGGEAIIATAIEAGVYTDESARAQRSPCERGAAVFRKRLPNILNFHPQYHLEILF